MMKSNKRLKVLFITTWYPSKEGSISGIFVEEHAKSAALYNDITVFVLPEYSSGANFPYEVFEHTDNEIRTIRIRQRPLPIPRTKYLIQVLTTLHYCIKLFKRGYKPDIIHAHIYSAGVPAVILGRIFKIPVAITEHWSGFPLRLLTTAEKMKARFAMNRARVILPDSKNLIKHIENYGIKNRFHAVPNTVNTELFYPQIDKIRNDEIKRILLVCSLLPVKGVPFLLEAIKRIKAKRRDFRLDIIGDGPNREDYENMAKELQINDLVKFLGFIPKREDVAEFMRRSDFFVLPSIWENLPCVIIEAMASGVPVVATKVGGTGELVDENAGILVPPKDAGSLAEAIDSMLDNCNSYSSERIAQSARDRFNYQTVGKILDNIYRSELLNR